MGRYADRTKVPVERSRAEIEKELRRFGADQIASAWQAGRHSLAFRYQGHQFRMDLEVPADEPAEERRMFRVLTMLVKARLIAVEEGLLGLGNAFLDCLVLPSGEKMGEWVGSQLESLPVGRSLPMLPQGEGGRI